MILLERGSRGLAPSQMSAAGEIFQDLRYATLDPTLDQVQPFQNWPWTTLALHRMGDLGPRWATLDRPWTAWSKVGPMPKSQHWRQTPRLGTATAANCVGTMGHCRAPSVTRRSRSAMPRRLGVGTAICGCASIAGHVGTRRRETK